MPMTDTTEQQLKDHCKQIAQVIETGEWEIGDARRDDEPDNPFNEGEECTAMNWLEDALDIQYLVSGKGEYRSARVLVAFGGPNIWVDTRTKTVEGYWGFTYLEQPYGRDELGLDDALAELWACR